jgi:hypothetical protein
VVQAVAEVVEYPTLVLLELLRLVLVEQVTVTMEAHELLEQQQEVVVLEQ